MGFWERAFANPGKNHDEITRNRNAQRKATQRAHRQRSAAEKRIKTLEAEVKNIASQLQDQSAELEARLEKQSAEIDLLRRCLIANDVIEEADLAAMLPASTVQDSEADPTK